MKIVRIMLATGLACVGSLAANAGTITVADVKTNAAHGCIEFHTTYRWQAIDDRHVVIWAWHTSDAYLIETTIPLTELSLSQRVDFVDGDEDGQLCGAHGDKIIVSGAALSQQASIATLTRLDSEQVAQVIEPAADSASHQPRNKETKLRSRLRLDDHRCVL
jgi:hypothetical protein